MNTNAAQLRESIRHLERKLGVLMESDLSCCGLTLAQCHALVEIGRACCISLIDLANTLDLDNSTLSRTVSKLDALGLCGREIDPNNRRYLQITLTESGWKLFNEIEANMNAYYQKVLERIPEDRRTQLLTDLSLLIDALAETDFCCEIHEKEG